MWQHDFSDKKNLLFFFLENAVLEATGRLDKLEPRHGRSVQVRGQRRGPELQDEVRRSSHGRRRHPQEG